MVAVKSISHIWLMAEIPTLGLVFLKEQKRLNLLVFDGLQSKARDFIFKSFEIDDRTSRVNIIILQRNIRMMNHYGYIPSF